MTGAMLSGEVSRDEGAIGQNENSITRSPRWRNSRRVDFSTGLGAPWLTAPSTRDRMPELDEETGLNEPLLVGDETCEADASERHG